MDILFGKTSKKKYDTALVFVAEDLKLGARGKILDDAVEGALVASIKNAPRFKGKLGQTHILPLGKGAHYKRVVVAGVGKAKELTDQKLRVLGGMLYDALKATGAVDVLMMPEEDGELAAGISNFVSEGVLRKSYFFDKYKGKKDDADEGAKLTSVTYDVDNSKALAAKFEATKNVIDGMELTRNLVSEPPNALYPDSFAKIVEKELKPLGVKVKVLDEKKLEKMGAGAIMAVGKGSARKPRLAILEYNGLGKKNSKPSMGIVGKGITFDTGGYNVKTSNMHWMQFDMGGAGTVAGAMKAIALNKEKVHVVAALALAENMISDEAYRPSDIITSLSGQTIEVLNTDAEGRLVMCDAMTYLQNEYKVETLVDVATLTGACMIALGNEYGGAFTPSDELWRKIETAGGESGDKVWRMPLDEAWDKEMKGAHADLKNLGDSSFAGASTAAAFLKAFVQEDVTWAHLDVAGVVWSFKPNDLWGKGATGYGVGMLQNLIKECAA